MRPKEGKNLSWTGMWKPVTMRPKHAVEGSAIPSINPGQMQIPVIDGPGDKSRDT